MIELLEAHDPARDASADTKELRALVDEKIGVAIRMKPAVGRSWKGWTVAIAAFMAVLVAVPPLLFRPDPANLNVPDLTSLAGSGGVDLLVPLASGGVQTIDVDGETIWVMSALARKLQKVSASSGELEEAYEIDGHVEGVTIGGGYLWLRSYENGGEVLRFDPASGQVDLVLPLHGPPGGASWFAGQLWVSNQDGDLFRISAAGDMAAAGRGDLKGTGFGYLWVNDPSTGLIKSVSPDGTVGEVVIPTVADAETMSGAGVRKVVEAAGYLWLMDGDYPWGTNLSRFNPETGEFRSMGGFTFGLLDIVEFQGSVWLVSHTDHLLLEVDPESGEFVSYAVPGKVGGLTVIDDRMWATFYQPGGSLVRLGPSDALVQTAPVVFDDWNRFPHRFLCTATPGATGPTVILEPSAWTEYGYLSVLQAITSAEGYTVCVNGYLEEQSVSAEDAAKDLADALEGSELPGPYLLASAGDGVHVLRTFAHGRTDIAGIVLVDPVPLGFRGHYDSLLPDWGHPPWLDIDAVESAGLGDFGDIPLTVIGQAPSAIFGSDRFIAAAGKEVSARLNEYWQNGLEFYQSLSTDSTSIVSEGAGLDDIVTTRPDVILRALLGLLEDQA